MEAPVLTNEEITSRVRSVLSAKLGTGGDKIDARARFDTDLRVSSLDMVEAIMAIEDEFGIEISDSDADTLHTVGDVVGLVRAKLPRSAAIAAMPVEDGAGAE